MPSIEIACLGLTTPLPPPPTSFALVCGAGLLSHRLPSRFQPDFDKLAGSLYHVGNPDLLRREGGAFFAYEILSEPSRNAEPSSFLEFAPSYLSSMRDLLQWLLGVSPVGQIMFTSDWQFGPEWSRRLGPLHLDEFWRLHDARELLLNAAYRVVRAD